MDKIAVQPGRWGKCCVATKNFSAGELILIFTGKKFHATRASLLPKDVRDHAIQIGPRTWIDAKTSQGRYASHSCNPNAGIHGLRKLVALRPIARGEEVTWDYATTENSDWYMSQPCGCNEKNCRKKIGPWRELPSTARQKYLRQGIVSSWIRQRE